MSKLTDNERTLVEAVKSMLDGKPALGLPDPDPDSFDDNNPELRGFEYLHGQINEMFRLKAAELTHFEGVCAAFSKVHNYKYLDDNTFSEAMDKEMVSQGIPRDERTQAIEFLPKIIEELKEESTEWAERDFGFHPNLDELREVSQPQQYEDQSD